MARSFKIPDCTIKEVFVIKERRPVRNTTKKFNQILDVENKEIKVKVITTNLNYLKDKHEYCILKLLQKHEEVINGT